MSICVPKLHLLSICTRLKGWRVANVCSFTSTRSTYWLLLGRKHPAGRQQTCKNIFASVLRCQPLAPPFSPSYAHGPRRNGHWSESVQACHCMWHWRFLKSLLAAFWRLLSCQSIGRQISHSPNAHCGFSMRHGSSQKTHSESTRTECGFLICSPLAIQHIQEEERDWSQVKRTLATRSP